MTLHSDRPREPYYRFVSASMLAAFCLLTLASGVAFGQTSKAYYVEARDGVRLAVDVNLPRDAVDGVRFPALLEFTRYGRSREDSRTGAPLQSLGSLDQFFLQNGYAVLKVDARGSGASFGSRPTEYGPEEVRDAYDVVDWILRQRWADGNVGAYGTSYSGTTAELLAAVNHPAVKAVAPGWSDFDVYVSPVRPYGLLSSSFLGTWGQMVSLMDENDTAALGYSIRRVDEDRDGSLLAAALRDHDDNPDVFRMAREGEYRDDRFGPYTWDELTPLHWRKEIQRSAVPMLILVSWMDAGTAEGALLRFRHFSNPQKVVIMAGSHGGRYHASPFRVGSQPRPPEPSVQEQAELRLAFFDHYLKGEDNGVENWPPMRYFNLGEEKFRETDSWPPPGTISRRLFMKAGGQLSNSIPKSSDGEDVYRVDPTVTTGKNNRWMTQMGAPVLNLDDRAEMDARMLTYTGAELEEDLQIVGQPVVTLHLSTDQADGLVLTYLEDVDEDGRSRYLTEGGLRLIHRRTVPDPDFGERGPYHSFRRKDASPMEPGVVSEVSFKMQPIAALIRAGHRVRIAIAGADADTFDPIPAEGVATLKVQGNSSHVSYVELPVASVQRNGSR